MKMRHTIVLMAAIALLTSCEPEEVLVNTFTPNTPDTTYVSGMNMRLNFNGNSFTYSSQGYGLSCTDSLGFNDWALITGNGVVFDPVTNGYSTAPGDTTLLLVFKTATAAVGSYNISSFEDAFCLYDAPNAFRLYDPTQLAINITRVTPDSIFGNYSGALLEYTSFSFDSLGNLIPVYSGQIDSVSTVFGLKRNPC